ncbi:MAG: class I SAM-dependent methyltransferase [Bacteroidales bacterium]|nr:class I SAM-dependent methyltransferase [Bacteroidales bacterium]
MEDFGAGSSVFKQHTRTVADLAVVASQRKVNLFMGCLAQYFKPETIVELGTSLGLTSMYMAANAPQSRVLTVEGCKQTAALARQNFNRLGAQNIELLNCLFEDALPALKEPIQNRSLVFVDGNHSYEATVSYFSFFADHAHNESLLVFDDINHSPGMQQAWKTIKESPSTTATIDFFRLGLAALSPKLCKQHFVVRF